MPAYLGFNVAACRALNEADWQIATSMAGRGSTSAQIAAVFGISLECFNSQSQPPGQPMPRATPGIIGAPGDTGPTGPCRPLSELDLAQVIVMEKQGRSAREIAAAIGSTEACLLQNLGRAIDTLPDPAKEIGDIGKGIQEGVLGALPTVAIVVVILLLLLTGGKKTLGL